MNKKVFIFLAFIFSMLLFAVVLHAADTSVTASEPASDQQAPAKGAEPCKALKGSEPVKGVTIGKPVTEEEMFLNPVKKKKRIKKQEETKDK